MSIPFASEKQVAIAAVRRACTLTDSVFNKLVKNETLTKDDKSPVTGKSTLVVLSQFLVKNSISDRLAVGDYSAQAVINTILSRAFPYDPIVGEESSSELRTSSASSLRSRIVELANEALGGDLGLGEMSEWGMGPGQERTEEELLDAIDRGNFSGGRNGREFGYPSCRWRRITDVCVRDVDSRSDRWDERVPPGWPICRMSCAYCGFPSRAWGDWMSELACGTFKSRWSTRVSIRSRTWTGITTTNALWLRSNTINYPPHYSLDALFP